MRCSTRTRHPTHHRQNTKHRCATRTPPHGFTSKKINASQLKTRDSSKSAFVASMKHKFKLANKHRLETKRCSQPLHMHYVHLFLVAATCSAGSQRDISSRETILPAHRPRRRTCPPCGALSSCARSSSCNLTSRIPFTPSSQLTYVFTPFPHNET